MNQLNSSHGEEKNEPTRECNRKPPPAHFKSMTYPPNTRPMVSAIMGRLTHHAIDNTIFTLQIFQLNLTLDLFHIQTPLRLNQLMIDEMDHPLEFFYSEHNEDLLYVYIQMLQD